MTNEGTPQNPGDRILSSLGASEQLHKQANQILFSTHQILLGFKDFILQQQTREIQASHVNPLNKYGRKCFSQTDEDGITLEIIRRLGIEKGVYAEFGVGNGIENNTLILAALGWKGFWVGGEDLAFNYGRSTRFRYLQDWITLENIFANAQKGLERLGEKNIDVVSLDLDGNDIYFVDNLLENNISPKLFIVEYNGKFPPPVKFQISYDAKHRWMGDDYFGASLSSFVELFAKFGYHLICCNAHTGSNAFFVKKEYMNLFQDVPTDINDIYVGPRYHLFAQHGHKPSTKVIEVFMNC